MDLAKIPSYLYLTKLSCNGRVIFLKSNIIENVKRWYFCFDSRNPHGQHDSLINRRKLESILEAAAICVMFL
jgi:hypothetical protein